MLETIQHAPLVTVGLLAVGMALGLVAGIFVLPAARRARRLETEIGALRADHDRYQRRVTEHFQTTAVLVGDLTSSYKAVYEHLASGARTLSDPALTSHGFGAPQLIVDGAGQDRLPQDPIAHDTDPVSESVPVEPTVADAPAAETGESAAAAPGVVDLESAPSPSAAEPAKQGESGGGSGARDGGASGDRPATAPQQ